MQKRASTSAASTNISGAAIKSSNGVLKALLAEPAPAIVPHRKKHPARNVEV